MATKAKKIIIISAISVAALMLFGSKKYNEAKKVLKNLKLKVQDISNIQFSLKNFTFDAIVGVTNPTNINFGATAGSAIAIKEIRIYGSSGTYIGKAQTNIVTIDLPANSTVNLPKLQFTVDLLKALQEFGSNMTMYLDGNFDNLKYKIDVEAFGNVVTLDAN